MPLQRRLPKLKGFSNALFKTTYQVVNLGRLAELFPEGGEVTPETLAANGAVRSSELVKVLGTGDLSVALRVRRTPSPRRRGRRSRRRAERSPCSVRLSITPRGLVMGPRARSALEFAGSGPRHSSGSLTGYA